MGRKHSSEDENHIQAPNDENLEIIDNPDEVIYKY
jgi:hypothetical protein